MARLGRICGLLAIAGLIPASCLAGPPDALRPPRLTLSVFNDARVPEKVIGEARERAEYILMRAGLALSWIDCGGESGKIDTPSCSQISFPEHLSIRLVKGASGASEDTFGQSYLNRDGEGSYASVYVSVLQASSAGRLLRPGDLLGDVIAHEIGHLLLGPSHSRAGIMCARWQPSELTLAARGGLLFSGEEAIRLRMRYELLTARHKSKERLSGLQSGF